MTAFIDTDRTLGADDMKVERDRRAGPPHRQDAHGLGRWLRRHDQGPRAAAARYWARSMRRWRRRGARSTSSACSRDWPTPARAACRDISGHGWLEVDLPEERDRAEEAVRGAAGRSSVRVSRKFTRVALRFARSRTELFERAPGGVGCRRSGRCRRCSPCPKRET